MATAYLRADSAPAYTLPLPPRAAIEAAVETLLGVLDALDGDPDVEDNGDERDDDGDTRDASFPEQFWQLGEHLRSSPAGWRWERGVIMPNGPALHEDAEQDDEPEQDDDDHEDDGREREEGDYVMHTGVDQTKAISVTNPAVV